MQLKAKTKAKATTAAVAPVDAPAAPVAPAKAPSPRVAAIATHNEAGFTGATYAGLSKPRNSGIDKAPNLATSKATPRTYAQLTERMHKTLAELAKAYAAKPFPLCGIDRGQAAIFLASGFFIAGENNTATLSPDTVKRYV